MKNTMEMMKTIIVGYESSKNLQDLINEYKEEQKPNILAYMFVKNFGVIAKLKCKYTMLTENDIASYALQELDKVMYNFDVSRNCKFTSYYVACLSNRLRCEQEQLLCNSRYVNYCVDDIENHYDISDEKEILDIFDINDYDLNDNEKKYCKLIMNGYTIKEISKILNYSVQALYNWHKNISKKLSKSL